MKYDISFDFDKCEIDTTRGGNILLISGKAALSCRIRKVLKTALHRFDIYFNEPYGNDLERCLIGKNYPMAYIASEAERIAKECIGKFDEVIDIGSFSVKRDGARLEIEFSANTIYGNEKISLET